MTLERNIGWFAPPASNLIGQLTLAPADPRRKRSISDTLACRNLMLADLGRRGLF
ncbi:MAG: hypothetical protein GY925_06620 [Actinomycetia bacterium]|nr:hypothetical protein [Actinomycetes bacterium]